MISGGRLELNKNREGGTKEKRRRIAIKEQIILRDSKKQEKTVIYTGTVHDCMIGAAKDPKGIDNDLYIA